MNVTVKAIEQVYLRCQDIEEPRGTQVFRGYDPLRLKIYFQGLLHVTFFRHIIILTAYASSPAHRRVCSLPPPLFGANPDPRLLAVLDCLEWRRGCPDPPIILFP